MVRSEALAPALDAVRDRLRATPVGRLLVGITGPPAAGKSTLATALAGALTRSAVPSVAVGMDGFHLANRELERQGLAGRKGAPQTFDAHGFVHLLRRLREPAEAVVYAPRFSRTLNESIGSAIPVQPGTRVIVIEGNYLLLDVGPWRLARELMDLVMYLDAPDPTRRDALMRRQLGRGLDLTAATDWVDGSDEANAQVIAATRPHADLVLERGPEALRRSRG
ncbi:MAG: nucleoside/nucleotide kinase family protein [Dactylosporangium sp.]|nr:nucleoside/nucleotide kinase family protein [Dactylosporangium sp.]NNJ60606.1 nucleoside/nucleotide kinase family protein [Dactylosporangium sp.]